MSIICTREDYEVDVYSISSEEEWFPKLLEMLTHARDDDNITLLFQSDGGSIDAGVQLIRAIKHSRADVHARIVSYCVSMASLVALSCDSFKMEKESYIMFHDYQRAVSTQKGVDLIADVVEHNTYLSRMNYRICTPFLTVEEVVSTENGKPLYIHDNDITLHQRINRHFYEGYYV